MIEKTISCFEKLNDAFAVTEKKNPKRHLHAAIFLKNEIKKSQIIKQLKKIQGPMDDAELRVLKTGVKVLYSDDWANQYLAKQDDTVIIYDHLPEHTDPYYPSKESQEKTIRRNGNTIENLIKIFKTSSRPPTLNNYINFIQNL